MDAELSKSLFEKEVEKMHKVMTEWIGDGNISIDGRLVYMLLPRVKDNHRFLLRISCEENFPIEPADYIFVNPQTKVDDGKEFWPDDNQQAFKNNENPRWMCLAGTKEYKKRHPEHQYNPKIHTMSQIVFHIFRQINGWTRVA